MQSGGPYGRRPTPGVGGTDPRQRRIMDVSRGFMNQRPAGSPVESRTRPSMYPDIQGFAQTPVGRMFLKTVVDRMRRPQQRGQTPPARM